MMKGTILKSSMLLLLTAMASSADAQTRWTYTYDAAGNRTKRVVTTSSAARKATAQQSNEFISEDGVTAVMDGSRNRIRIETLGKTGTTATVYNLAGRELLTRTAEAEQIMTIDISKLGRGVYILAIEADGEKKSCKFNK